jgi:hypothetical protein
MLLDYQERFGTDQPVLAIAVDSTNVLDLRDTIDRTGDTMTVEFLVTEVFAGGTSLLFEVVESVDAAHGTDTVAVSTSVLLAGLALGTKVHIQLPRKLKRYLGTRLTPTGTFTTGEVSAYLVEAPQTNDADVTVEFLAIDNSGR